MNPARSTRVASDSQAYHGGPRTVVNQFLPDCEPVQSDSRALTDLYLRMKCYLFTGPHLVIPTRIDLQKESQLRLYPD